MRRLSLSNTVLAAAMALGMVFAAAEQGHAFVINSTTSVGDTFLVKFQLNPGNTDNGGNTLTGSDPLTATLVYTVTSLDLSATGGVGFTIDISNTTVATYNDTITSFGFFVDPDLAVSSFTGGSTFGSFEENTTFPSFQTIDVCIFSDGCTGGNINTGLSPGDTDTIMLSMEGDLSGGSLTVDPSVIKFQGDRGSYEFAGTDVPEPAPLAVIGFGLVALSWLRRRHSFCRITSA